MDGITLCPHCDTHFRIIEAQLHAHQGMVRCGHCLQTFDARPSFVPDQPSPQIELPILDRLVVQADRDILPPDKVPGHIAINPNATIPETTTLNMSAATVPPQKTLAERIVVVHDQEEDTEQPERRTWLRLIVMLLLLLILVAQAIYWFRVDIAARMPGLKPALVNYCRLLKCSVPLPKNSSLIGIESSDLESGPAQPNQIILSALLRNRASYALAFPDLELTLNDTQDKALARRIFKPADYLPPTENETVGLLSNHEVNIKLRLDTADLKPSGYRLALFYPN